MPRALGTEGGTPLPDSSLVVAPTAGVASPKRPEALDGGQLVGGRPWLRLLGLRGADEPPACVPRADEDGVDHALQHRPDRAEPWALYRCASPDVVHFPFPRHLPVAIWTIVTLHDEPLSGDPASLLLFVLPREGFRLKHAGN